MILTVEHLTRQIQMHELLGELAPMTSDYQVIVRLVDEHGEVQEEQVHDLAGGAGGTSNWQPGRWLFRTFAIEPEQAIEAGPYRVQIRLVDPKSGNTIEPRLSSDAGQLKKEPRDLLTVAMVQIR